MSEKIAGIDGDDYSYEYRKRAKALEATHDFYEMDELCYSTFHCYADGKKLMELMKDRFLYPMYANPYSNNFDQQCMFYEGFKECIRTMLNSVKAHKQRLDAEALKASGE